MVPLHTCGRKTALEKFMSAMVLTPNRSLEWTSASWPRYAACIFSAPRGQLAAAAQLER
jgi:hypothetical protein